MHPEAVVNSSSKYKQQIWMESIIQPVF